MHGDPFPHLPYKAAPPEPEPEEDPEDEEPDEELETGAGAAEVVGA